MAGRKRPTKRPSTPSERARQRERVDRLAAMVTRRVLEGLNPILNREIRREVDMAVEGKLADVVASELLAKVIQHEWTNRYAKKIDARVLTVVKSLRLRFAEGRSDTLFDLETESEEQSRGGLYRPGDPR